MANFQISDLDEFLAAQQDGFESPDEFMQRFQPEIEQTIQMPEEHIYQSSVNGTSGKIVEGEITRMLRTAPGILPAVDRFPKSYKPPKPSEQPDFIPQDRFNKIPILLSSKYFNLDGDDNDNEIEVVSQNVRNIVNNLSGSGKGNGNEKSTGRSSRSNKNCASGRSDGSNRSSSSTDELEKRFKTVFCNDAISDEDNCNVRSSSDSSSHQNPIPQEAAKPAQQYYNARQIYEMKRGKKQ